MDQTTKSRLTTGVMLILLGLALYGMREFGHLGKSFLLLGCGAMFIIGYLSTRTYALLVVGGVLFGLGFGYFGEARDFVLGDFWKVGLGIGFVLIWLIALLYERCSHWWPLVPGTVLILLGFETWGRVWRFLVSDGWPLILVILGVLFVLGAMGRKKKRQPAGAKR